MQATRVQYIRSSVFWFSVNMEHCVEGKMPLIRFAKKPQPRLISFYQTATLPDFSQYSKRKLAPLVETAAVKPCVCAFIQKSDFTDHFTDDDILVWTTDLIQEQCRIEFTTFLSKPVSWVLVNKQGATTFANLAEGLQMRIGDSTCKMYNALPSSKRYRSKVSLLTNILFVHLFIKMMSWIMKSEYRHAA